jgi:predicted O-methyltransferase YrrM
MASHGGGGRTDLPGMAYGAFFDVYGRSYRTKNLVAHPTARTARIKAAAKLLLGRHQTASRTVYALPATSALPREFIRLDPWEGAYLFMLAQLATFGVVEIGRFHGGSTFLLSSANREIPIWSIDVISSEDERLRRLFANNDTGENVELLVGDSHAGAFPEIGDFDLLFVDGDHTHEGVLADLERFFPRLAPGGHVLVHDCYPEMEVLAAVVDFVSRHDVAVIQSPYIPSEHWRMPAGSLVHFVKRDGRASTSG